MKQLLPHLKAAAALLILAAFTSTTPLTAKYWVGGTSNNWDDGANWSDGTVPVASDNINFFISSSTVTININSGVAAVAKAFEVLCINSSTLNLNINSGGSLTLDGNGTVAHGFVIKTYSGSSANITVNGDLHVEHFATRNIYLYNQSSAPIQFTNTGTITVVDCGSYGMHIDVNGGAVLGASNTFLNQGTLNISDGSQFAMYISGFSSRPSVFSNEGLYTVEDMNYIAFANSNGTFSQSSSGSTEGGGIIKHIGPVLLDGDIETFGGDPDEISLEVGGPSSGFDLSTISLDLIVEGTAGKGVSGGNDHINIVGDATLSGATVNITFEGGFVPSPGQSFQFITVSGTTTGSPTFVLPTPPPGAAYSMSNVGGIHTLTVDNSPFPVEFLSIDAVQQRNAALISWQTASETNNDGFVVQRSRDGLVWEALDFVAGSGTTLEVQSYQYLDYSATEGRNLYRLQQWDLDGQMNYSDAVELTLSPTLQSALKIYPVPASTSLTIEGVAGSATLLNGLGQVVTQRLVDGSPQVFDISFLPDGLYYLQIETPDQQIVQGRWMKE